MKPLPPRAFTLLELLIVVAIIGILAVIGLAAGARALRVAKKTDAVARLRELGQAAYLYAGDNDGKLPGPLWPGQVLLYDPARDGRMVRDLASYLGVEPRTNSYVVDRLFPKAYRDQMPPGDPGDARVYVVNPGWVDETGKTNLPFGSLTDTPTAEPMKMAGVANVAGTNNWMISEADQLQPYVASAPWKASTPAQPLHDGYRAVMRFDGSVDFERAR